MLEEEMASESKDTIKQKIRARYKGVDRDILEFIPARPVAKLYDDASYKRVCAYCRVSTGDPHQTTSYELQKNYYEDKINSAPNWSMVGLYADEGISGTSLMHREEFKKMIRDCEAGKIDLILTKGSFGMSVEEHINALNLDILNQMQQVDVRQKKEVKEPDVIIQ